MSNYNSSLLTDASRDASEINILDYELSITKHIANGLEQHSKTEMLDIPYPILAIAGDQASVVGSHNIAGEYTTSTSKILKVLVKSSSTEYVVGLPALNEYEIFEEEGAEVEFSVQPIPTSALLNKSATVSVQVVGALPIVYQWRKNGEDILNENSNSLTIPVFKESDVGLYSCVAMNYLGEAESESVEISLV